MKKKIKFLLGSLTAILAAYLFAIAPKKRKTRLITLLTKYDYAHRGLYENSWGIPENSMTAFKRAIDHNYGIELDIHLTKDNQLVVFHDDSLWRMCRLKKDICDMTYEEIKELYLLGSSEPIPLFKDVLELVNEQVPLIIELKVDHGNYKQLCTAADQILAQYRGPYCIESFHPLAVHWYRKNRSEVIRGQLSCNFYKNPSNRKLGSLALSHLITNFASRPDFIAYNYQDIKNLGFFLNHNLFKAMTVLWTVQNSKDMELLKKCGHVIIFENFEP